MASSTTGDVTWPTSESISIHKNMGKGLFFNIRHGPTLTPWLGYEFMLLWHKRCTFLWPEVPTWSVMPNCVGWSRSQVGTWFIINLLMHHSIWWLFHLCLWERRDISQWTGVCFSKVVGEQGVNSVYIWSVFRVHFGTVCTLMIL